MAAVTFKKNNHHQYKYSIPTNITRNINLFNVHVIESTRFAAATEELRPLHKAGHISRKPAQRVVFINAVHKLSISMFMGYLVDQSNPIAD